MMHNRNAILALAAVALIGATATGTNIPRDYTLPEPRRRREPSDPPSSGTNGTIPTAGGTTADPLPVYRERPQPAPYRDPVAEFYQQERRLCKELAKLRGEPDTLERAQAITLAQSALEAHRRAYPR